jgi:serine beta-lactamase-like protein LACTB, mitochondrial
MAAEEWRSLAFVGDTATAAERDMIPKTHCIDTDQRHQIRALAETCAWLLASLLVANGAAAQTGKLAAEKQAKIENAISTFMTESQTPGVSAAVVQQGELVWSAGFGMADLENSVPATSNTLYRLGSISKPLTATAAMALWEHGRLDLDSPVQKYCPAFPQKPWPVTTRQLLGNLGGIRSYNVPEQPYSVSQSDPEVGNTRHFDNGIEGGLKFFANDPLVAQPGTHFNYSTQGYTVAGCAIEGASGQKYADAVRETVLIPAGMLQTRPDERFAIVPLRTRFYSKDKTGAVMNAEFLDASYKVPGGGWLSSAPDMARFEAAIMNNRLLKSATRDTMWTQPIPSDGLGRLAYALGWQFGAVEGLKIVGHGGSQQGTSTMIWMAPDARAGVVVLTNSDSSNAPRLAIRLLRIVLGLPEHEHKEIAVDPKVFDGYVGIWQLGDFKMTIAREGDRLFAQVRDQKISLSPESARDYVLKGTDNHLTFSIDRNGRPELILRESGIDAYLNR